MSSTDQGAGNRRGLMRRSGRRHLVPAKLQEAVEDGRIEGLQRRVLGDRRRGQLEQRHRGDAHCQQRRGDGPLIRRN